MWVNHERIEPELIDTEGQALPIVNDFTIKNE
jgi:hypothetical protein